MSVYCAYGYTDQFLGPVAMIRVFINGISGRMGQMAFEGINAQTDMVCIGGASSHESLINQLDTFEADLCLDFTKADQVMNHVGLIIAKRIPLLIGTSGIDQQQADQLAAWTKTYHSPCWQVSNFSIGAVLMMDAAQRAAQYYPSAQIIERHAAHKIDQPSQTAFDTRTLMTNIPDIEITSIRDNRYKAEQDVILSSPYDQLVIAHHVTDRRSYLPGILLAIRHMKQISGFCQGLGHMLKHS